MENSPSCESDCDSFFTDEDCNTRSSEEFSSNEELLEESSDCEIKIDFGMEIELTSAYDANKIKLYYLCCGQQFNNESFYKMEGLFERDIRKFILYRNIVACFANGLDASIIDDLFYKTKRIFFVVQEKRVHVWSLQASSAFVGTKNYVMMVNWDNPSAKTFNMEFDEITLKKVFKNIDGPFGMINEGTIKRRKIIKFDEAMVVDWKENEVETKQLLNDLKQTPTIQDLIKQIKTKSNGGAPKHLCMYPNCNYRNHKYKLVEHYCEHDNFNHVLYEETRRNRALR